MKVNFHTTLLALTLVLSPVFLFADGGEEAIKRYTISGVVTDKENGETLLGATVNVNELETGTATNLYGFYSISLFPGNYSLTFSYIGYQTLQKTIALSADITLNIELTLKEQMLEEVVIQGEMKREELKKAETSVFRMDTRTIRQIPALMGEVDIIKAIQLLPGVQSAAEGTSGFSVRGGNPDQNLILLDEATVYNASHLMGFFSVFNNDAIKDVALYKGDIPAAYGGRLSSMLDIRMKEGNSKNFSGTGGIGTISSRLTLEGPISKDRISFMLSGRRTYADLFLRLSKNEDLRYNTLYFYDLNAKLNFRINDKNRLYLSAYKGKDIFKNDDFRMGWGNQTVTLRWNHLMSKKIFSNFSLIYSLFDYSLGMPEGEPASFTWEAGLEDVTARTDFGWYISPSNTLKFGLSGIFHGFHPGSVRGTGDETFVTDYDIQHSLALESGIYVSNEQKAGDRFNFKYGLRLSVFNNIGSGIVYHFNTSYKVDDSTVYPAGQIYNTYWGLEPRIGISYALSGKSSLKAGYARNRQYVNLASNSTAGTPLDIWFPSSPNVRPQIADQVDLGYYRHFMDHTIETSVEGFYKHVRNAIDFKDHAELLLNRELEGELRFGDGQSYGLELLVRKTEGAFSGWISYTWSRSFREIKEINDGREYVSPYDRPNNVSVVLNYDLKGRLIFGINWVYSTGSPVTFPTGGAWYQGVRIPVYSDRNSYRLPDYHRMDFSLTYRGKGKPDRKWHGELNLSLYNVYNRKNTWVINFEQEPDDPSQLYAEKTYLFGIVPALTYNFRF
jgi:hypothetical protein